MVDRSLPVAWRYLLLIEAFVAGFLLHYFPVTVVSVLLLQSIVFMKRYRISQRHIPFVIILPVLIVYSYTGFNKNGHALQIPDTRIAFSGVVTDLPVRTEKGWYQAFSLLEPVVNDNARVFLVTPLPPGTFLQGTGFIKRLQPRYNPGLILDNRKRLMVLPESLTEVDPAGDSIWYQQLRWRLFWFFRENFSDEVSAVLNAIVIGHVTDSTLYTLYGRTGIAHLLSISGTHFGLLAIVVFNTILWIFKILPLQWLYRISAYVRINTVAAVFSLPLLGFYLLLSGGRIPAVRSFIMVLIFVFSLIAGRTRQWFYAVLIAALVILFLDPSAIVNTSFQLSFMAVLAIGATLELTQNYVSGLKNRYLQTGARMLLITSGAYLGLLPVIAYKFHYISLIAIVFNILVTPLICFIVLPLSLCLTVIYLIIGIFPFKEALNEMILFINNFVVTVGTQPWIWMPVRGFPVAVLFVLYGTGIWVLLRRKTRWVIVLFCVSTAVILGWSRIDRGTEITFLDVGQAEASVIKDRDTVVVIDTGRTGVEVIKYLRYLGVREIDALIITHAGKDHAGGVFRIIREFPVREVWHNGLVRFWPPLSESIRQRGLSRGMVLKKDNLEFLVLHPYRGYYSWNGNEQNNQSLVIRFSNKDISVLFTGDIERDAEEILVSAGGYLQSRILKIAHHGSQTSSTSLFLSAVSPEIVVISAGRDNPYGHPHRDVLKRLKRTHILRTDLHGAIKLSSSENTLHITLYRDFLLARVKGGNLLQELKNLKSLLIIW